MTFVSNADASNADASPHHVRSAESPFLELSASLAERLKTELPSLRVAFNAPSAAGVRCCWLDHVLPPGVVEAAYAAAPPVSAMVRRADTKERKYVSADIDRLGSPVANLVRALAQQPVADVVADIMGKPRLEVDARLYNGGLTSMVPGDFMCPHLDNSHDYDRVRRRDVVLLLYLTPDWRDADGGGLELWSRRRNGQARFVGYRSNRLVILETTERSWHSIRPIVGDKPRVSLTTYFYAPVTERAPLRLTRFTSWPGQPLRALQLSAEFHLRNVGARAIRRRLRANRHSYTPTTSASVKADV